MKNWIAVIIAVVMIWSLSGCAPAANGTEDTSAPQPTPAAPTATPQPTAAPSPAPLAALSGITAAEVRQISVYGGSQPPDTPEEVYCTDADVPAMLDWLQGIMAAPAPGPVEEFAPGNWRTYDVELFDGTIVTVFFAGDTLSTGGVAYTYTTPDKPDLAKPLRLFVEGESFPAGTETINYSIINEAGGEQVLLFVPTLGNVTPSGWIKLDCEAGFCSVADPVDARVLEHELPLKEWFPDAGPGVYRLSMLAYDDNGDPYMIADVFEIE